MKSLAAVEEALAETTRMCKTRFATELSLHLTNREHFVLYIQLSKLKHNFFYIMKRIGKVPLENVVLNKISTCVNFFQIIASFNFINF